MRDDDVKARFSKAGLRFLAGLARHNDREWFEARRDVYENEIKVPMLAVCEQVSAGLGKIAPANQRPPQKAMLRIYRDTRFSKDKLPYKTHVSAWFGRSAAPRTTGGGFYLHVSAKEVVIAAGCFMAEDDQALNIRRMLSTETAAYRAALKKALRGGRMKRVTSEAMKRGPKGFAADDPAMDLLLERRWGAHVTLPPETALTPDFVAKAVLPRYADAAEMVSLLADAATPAARRVLL